MNDIKNIFLKLITYIAWNNTLMENVFIVDNNLCLNIFMDDENIFCSFILVSDTNDLFRENIFQIVLFSAKETDSVSECFVWMPILQVS